MFSVMADRMTNVSVPKYNIALPSLLAGQILREVANLA